mmetsp:Transcript_39811/g.91083  ORF Transcript_39811/g.91083 Transcript_39811/m.91083 type:complete len:215 (+) Transcript_39811:35-679(+)
MDQLADLRSVHAQRYAQRQQEEAAREEEEKAAAAAAAEAERKKAEEAAAAAEAESQSQAQANAQLETDEEYARRLMEQLNPDVSYEQYSEHDAQDNLIPAAEDDGVRAPMRTGYMDRLIDPVPQTSGQAPFYFDQIFEPSRSDQARRERLLPLGDAEGGALGGLFRTMERCLPAEEHVHSAWKCGPCWCTNHFLVLCAGSACFMTGVFVTAYYA